MLNHDARFGSALFVVFILRFGLLSGLSLSINRLCRLVTRWIYELVLMNVSWAQNLLGWCTHISEYDTSFSENLGLIIVVDFESRK